MECRRYREPLDLVESADSADPYFAEALGHAGTCAACGASLRRRLAREAELARGLESLVLSAPDRLGSALFPGAFLSRRRALVRYVSLAASVVLVVTLSAGGWSLWESSRRSSAVRRLCALSIKNHEVYTGAEFTAADAGAVDAWLSRRLGRVVRFPASVRRGAGPLAARRSLLGEHEVAAVEFAISGRRSTVFSYYPSQYRVEGVVERPKTEMGYTVAFWSEDGLGYGLVSEAPPEKVRAVLRLAGGR